MDFEGDDVAPVRHPLVEQVRIVCLHELVATLERRVDPARDIRQLFWREPSMIAESPIHGDGIAALEVFDHHVEHLCHRVSLQLATRTLAAGGELAVCDRD